MKIKGTRTYQLTVILILTVISQAIEQWTGVSINIDQQWAAGLAEIGLQVYAAALAGWKILQPHPMKHEQTAKLKASESG